MTALLVLKILGMTALISGVGAAYAEWGPEKRRQPWQRQRVRRDPGFGHFLAGWAVGWVILSLLVLFIIWYLRR